MADNQQNNTGDNNDILAREAELLGTGTGTQQSGGSSATGQKPVAVNLQQAIAKYNIPVLVTEHYPQIISLIIQTESMDDDERTYWFQMIPIMTGDQIKKLEEILNNEKEQLAKLDAEYEEELKKIDEKHMREWKEFEMKQKQQEIERKETISQQEEEEIEQELLNKLKNL